MIRIIDGPLGSGKTYFVVNYICTHYATYDSFYHEWILSDDVVIITNIDGFKLKHQKLDELIKKYTLDKFFTVDNFEKIQSHYRSKHILLIVDEAQKYFPKEFKQRDVCFLFEWSRHLGLDIFLLTQHSNKISRELVPLSEGIIKALPQSQSMPGVLRYVHCDTRYNENYKTALRTKPNIFSAYKSFVVEGKEKPKSIYIRLALTTTAAVLVCVVALTLFFTGLRKGTAHGKSASTNITHVSTIPRPASPPVPVSALPSSVASASVAKNYSSVPVPTRSGPEGQSRSAVKVRVDGFVSNGHHSYYLINNQVVQSARVIAYNRSEGTAYYLDDGVSPSTPAALAGAMDARQPGPVVPVPAVAQKLEDIPHT